MSTEPAQALIAALLPSCVEVEDVVEDLPVTLLAEEEAAVLRAVPKRRREFATVRACARTALGRLGVEPVAILPGESGAPAWPSGIVGSMTHCDGYRAAAAARRADVASIGIDAEPDEPLPDGVLALVSLEPERAQLAWLARERPGVCWDRLLFSAKESVYKAWFPLAGCWLGFEQAVVTIDPDAGSFRARLRADARAASGERIGGFEGRWAVRDGLALTAIAHGRERLGQVPP
jgi:4'-phosphopantetheinyl transferase EntD